MPAHRLHKARAFFSRIWPLHESPSVIPTTLTPLNLSVHDLARIGGVSILRLPIGLTPYDLVLPTRFAALAQYLVDVGMCSPDVEVVQHIVDLGHRCYVKDELRKGSGFDVQGLFRIPGSAVVVGQLRGWFERQVRDFDGMMSEESMHRGPFAAPGSSGRVKMSCSSWRRKSAEVEYTIRFVVMPSQRIMPYQIHDVASCFKSFLSDLEGGVLGSLLLFDGLRKAVCPSTIHISSGDADDGEDGDSSSLEWKCAGIDDPYILLPSHPDKSNDDVDPRHVARVLCSGTCSVRRNLIFAVFGLLAFFKVDNRDSAVTTAQESQTEEQEVHYHFNRSVQTVLDEIRQHDGFIGQQRDIDVPKEARMTSDSLGRIFAPIFLDETRMKQIKLDANQQRTSSRGKGLRASWGLNPHKQSVPQGNCTVPYGIDGTCTPTKSRESLHSTRMGGTSRLSRTTTAAGSPLPCPSTRTALQNASYANFHRHIESDSVAVSSRPIIPAPETIARTAGPSLTRQPSLIRGTIALPFPACPSSTTGMILRRQMSKLTLGRSTSTTRRHFPSSATAALGKKRHKIKVNAKSMAALQDQQDRILLIARVIAGVVRIWEDVVVELRELGCGDVK